MWDSRALTVWAFTTQWTTVHHFGPAGFVVGQLAEIGIVPGGDALGVEVNDRELDLEAAIGGSPLAAARGWCLPSGLGPLLP